MSDLDSFRAEARAWLEDNAPDGIRNLPPDESLICWGGRKWVFRNDDQRLWLERMAVRGWTAPEWPAAYGGGDLDAAQARCLAEEIRRIGASPPLYGLGIWMLGPALLAFGTEAQKRAHLPAVARGHIRWAQGYSEPGAGSDLASVQMKGEDIGDCFLVNGCKTWTSHADACDMIFALVRTEPAASKHAGLSFLLIDMADPAVTTRPIRMISGETQFSETFFDNVRVPKENVVGGRGEGWRVAKYLLGRERAMMAGKPVTSMGEDSLLARASRVLGPAALAAEGALRADIVQYEMEAWAMHIALERARDRAAAGLAGPADASMLKLAGTELNRRRSELMMSIEGAAAFPTDGPMAKDWLNAPAYTIAGGTSEIQLNIIAKHALGLPQA